MLDHTRRMGEPMISGFEPQTLGTALSGVGFRLLEDLGPQDQEACYFRARTDGFRATEHSTFAVTKQHQTHYTSTA
jgi:O-methyltransferase involved in polyketide biosynthesis